MKINFNKKYRIWLLPILFALTILLIVILKLLNQYYYGTSKWFLLVEDYITSDLQEQWFTGQNIIQTFLLGPIGLKSIIYFNL